MNGIKLFTGLAALGLAASISLHATAGETFKIKEGTKVKWVGKKVTGEHYGSISLKSGTIEAEKGKLSGGTFVMNMPTLGVEDLTGEYQGKLEGHLKSDDFFSTEKFKTATMKIVSVSPVKGSTYNITADLTIKGITKKVEFPVQMSVNGETFTAKGTITVDRTQYDIKYGSGSFFDDLGDKMIEDNFTISFEIGGNKIS